MDVKTFQKVEALRLAFSELKIENKVFEFSGNVWLFVALLPEIHYLQFGAVELQGIKAIPIQFLDLSMLADAFSAEAEDYKIRAEDAASEGEDQEADEWCDLASQYASAAAVLLVPIDPSRRPDEN